MVMGIGTTRRIYDATNVSSHTPETDLRPETLEPLATLPISSLPTDGGA